MSYTSEYAPLSKSVPEPLPPLFPRDREYENIRRKCKPLRIGVVLIMAMVLAVAYGTLSRGASSLLSLALVAVASALTMIVLISLCETDNQTAAWALVIGAPLVIGAFALQIESILLAIFGVDGVAALLAYM
jgi:lysylphosphatidylglycerol synthetase-like protein (DUF2156 family)|uniref:Uncharacterized protein n=1 Tax=viral metagenome TaxID=1070528 RepID=A0A6C0IWJ7_9ZZZZ